MLYLFLALAVTGLALILAPTSTPATPNDFSAYWTAGNLLSHGMNPYDSPRVLALERTLGFRGESPLVMLNPPWALPLVVPFGVVPFAVAKSLWFVLGLLLTLVSIYWLWELYDLGQRPAIGLLAAGTFLPVAVVLTIGQIGPLVLFGVSAFLRFERKGANNLAGCSLYLVALKPHLSFLLWPALVLWMMRSRRWGILSSFTFVMVTASAVAWLADPHVFSDYIRLLQGRGIVVQENPTIGGALQHWTGVAWLQFLPASIALVWFAADWMKRRANWQWPDRLPLLLLVSMASVSYAWFFDQVILLPALLNATALAMSGGRAKWAVAFSYLGMNAIVLLLILDHRTMFWYAWTAPTWLILYLAVQWQVRKTIQYG